MSVSYRAHAIIGVSISKSDLFKTKRVKAFDHNYPEDWLVDPKTQKKLWYDSQVCILNDFGHGITAVSDGNYDGDEQYFIGNIVSDGSYRDGPGFMQLPSTFSTLKKALKDLLEPHGLWNPKDFGLYAVQYVSY